MKFLLDSGWESPAIYRTIPGEASLSEEEDDPLESTSCFLYCLLFCTPALSGESSDPLLLSPSYNTFNIYTYCTPTGDVIFKRGVKLSFIYIKQWNIILELCVCKQLSTGLLWKLLTATYMCSLTLAASFCLEGEADLELSELLDDPELSRSFHTVNIYILNTIKNFIVISYRKNGGINCLTVTDRSYI